jgi:two-component system, OmpR family, phosphate regulon sensor histidine kinase PhoR
MTYYFRRRSTLYPAITLSVVLMLLNITLMVCWIVLLAQLNSWSALTIGTIVFALMLVGLSLYLGITIKEVRLNQRQANFVDSVTHELKSPIATLQLYLETLQMRNLDDTRRKEFFAVMERELQRLDHLISQLLEVGRLDAIGEQHQPEDISLEPLLLNCAQAACTHHKVLRAEVFRFDIQPAVVHTRRLILEMIFNNLLDNAIKYADGAPAVEVQVKVNERNRVTVRICDNGSGVESKIRKKIFHRFYRGGNELERRQTGTGLGLFIVRTLVRKLKGKISVHDRDDRPGSVFEVELPGRAEICAS